ncbi:phosphatidylinositol-binding protein scs2 [Kickxella alabastrina]|uniref:Phosphatidylinositol-binding protein scs2 n=1 Tax=Kickxella alabastrina TaxID=61397 RepID=A0ACC1I680_9FUNG|nr:phosphatidylinositol-binding protein scs2 [Kickxella alabastrina]
MALVYEPGDALSFQQPFVTQAQDQLRLTNKNNSPVAFKVKTTAPKQYCVRPNAGRIEPGDSVEVQVVLQPMKEDPPADFKCRDKFLIQSIQITPEMDSMPMTELWSMVEREAKSSISEKKLRVRYLQPESSDKQSQQSITGSAAATTSSGTADEKSASGNTGSQQQRSVHSSRPLPGPSPLAKSVDTQVDSPGEESGDNSSPHETPKFSDTSLPAAPAVAVASKTTDNSAVAGRVEESPKESAEPCDVVSKKELETAQGTIEDLKQQLNNYRHQLESATASWSAVSAAAVAVPAGGRAVSAQASKTVDGLSMHSVVIVALAAFMVGYFFF